MNHTPFLESLSLILLAVLVIIYRLEIDCQQLFLKNLKTALPEYKAVLIKNIKLCSLQ
jgi:hypothetical protein